MEPVEALSLIARRLRTLRLLLRDPGAWSAEWYRRKNQMDFAALKKEELERKS